jgi:small subunit ribosomal protein S4
MGDPKYPRKAWRKPKRPLNFDLKMEELKILGTFGLRTKKELWKAHTKLSSVRHQARSLLALQQDIREEKEPILMKSLARVGLVSSDATLDDVLNLQVNDLLTRRLQTLVHKKFGFQTPYQARQAVVHGHIMIGNRVINIPSYTVKTTEEEQIKFTPESKFPEILEKSKGKSEPVVKSTSEDQAEIPFETIKEGENTSEDQKNIQSESTPSNIETKE